MLLFVFFFFVLFCVVVCVVVCGRVRVCVRDRGGVGFRGHRCPVCMSSEERRNLFFREHAPLDIKLSLWKDVDHTITCQ